MKITKTPFEGLLVIEPRIFEDSRGSFFESYNKKAFTEAGISMDFFQDNQSYSRKGILRGLHFQTPPFAQTKLVRTLSGNIQDVVVDLRRTRTTYGKYFSLDLSAENKKQILIPKGFAHGFLVLSEFATVLYKCDEYYHPEAEGGVCFDDPAVGINWNLPHAEILLSDKDLRLPPLSELSQFF